MNTPTNAQLAILTARLDALQAIWLDLAKRRNTIRKRAALSRRIAAVEAEIRECLAE